MGAPRTRRARRSALWLTPLLLLPACAWLADRGRDALDLVVLEGMVGLGLSVDVKATELAHVGVGYAHGRKLGLRGRQVTWLRDRELGFPVSLLLWLGALRDGELWRLGHLHTTGSELWYGDSAWRLADVEAGVFAGVLGLRVGFSPGELVDFLAGWVGLDPAGDDEGPAPETRPEEPVEPGVWLVGDLHAHCAPPDGGHAPVSPAETRALAASSGLDFVGINPHLWFRGWAPRERPDLVAFVKQVRALEQEPGPLLIPGFEVMLRGRAWLGLNASGHALLLFRDLADAYAFDDPAPDERSWVRRRLALPPERRLWVPTHPWPHPRIRIPFFPDWAADWKQAEEVPRGAALLGGRGYVRWATPWQAREARRSGERHRWRLVRYRLNPAARRRLHAAKPWDAREQASLAGQTWKQALSHLIRRLAPPDFAKREAGAAELAHAAKALTAAIARERRPGATLELALDVGRNAWVWVRVGPRELELSWGATPVVRGEAETPLHDVPVDGLETLSGLVHLASRAVGRRGLELDDAQGFRLLERRMLAERRRLVPLAGSDNHRDMLFPTLWVFAQERSREAVFEALRLGRVCVGGPQAQSLRVRTDRDGTWRAVGAAPRADAWVQLRWRGSAELFVDGRSRGVVEGGFRHEVRRGSFHVYRIRRGPSRSGWVYVNLPE